METLYLSGESELSRSENTILIKNKKGKHRLPIEKVRHVVITTDGTLSTKFLHLCGSVGARVSVFDYYGWYKGSYEPIERNVSGDVVLRQAALILGSERLHIAQKLVQAAIKNSLSNLLYYHYRATDKSLNRPIEHIRDLLATVARADTIESCMGVEGMARRAYLEAWPMIDSRLDFGKRVKRPPNNQINCLISFFNGMTYAAVRHEIAKTHLNDTLAFLHSPSHARSSLSLDLSEPFKPAITDRIIFKAIRKNIADNSWFDMRDNVCLLNDVGRKAAIELFCKQVDAAEGNTRSLRTEMYYQALRLERKILGLGKFQPYRRTA